MEYRHEVPAMCRPRVSQELGRGLDKDPEVGISLHFWRNREKMWVPVRKTCQEVSPEH